MVAAPWGARTGMGAWLPAPGQLWWVLVQPQRGCLLPALLGLGMVPVSPQAPGAGRHGALWPWCCKVVLALGVLPRAAAMLEGCVQQRDVSSAGAAVVFRGCLVMGAFPDGYK